VKILHTSDWHLGKLLEGRERLPEQKAALMEICQIADERQVDLVLIAGDIFDTYVPSAAAEELFFNTVERLAKQGERAVVVIAGNHDSPERLCAAKPLADRHGIILLGLPASQASVTTAQPNSKVVRSGPGWMELVVNGTNVVIITLPYPSEARLNEVLNATLDEELLQKAYSDKVGAILNELAKEFRDDTVNLVISHLFMRGGECSESERPIQLGGALTVEPAQLPSKAQYVALGHLHKPQEILGATVPAYYSGSLLAYSFSEIGYQKAVFIIDAHPGQPVSVEKIELKSGKPLVKWVAQNGVPEVLEWIDTKKDDKAWIDLEVWVKNPLGNEEIRAIRSRRDDIITIRPVIEGHNEVAITVESRSSQPIDQLFINFYHSKIGILPRPELVDYFLRIVNQEDAEDSGGGGDLS